MDFRHNSAQKSEPELNLVPLIDVMLVIIIFLVMNTTLDETSGLDIALPTGDAPASSTAVSQEIVVGVTAAGTVNINGRAAPGKDISAIAAALANARPAKGPEPVVVINADAQAAHQNVINVMQAAQNAGLSHVTFAIRQEAGR